MALCPLELLLLILYLFYLLPIGQIPNLQAIDRIAVHSEAHILSRKSLVLSRSEYNAHHLRELKALTEIEKESWSIALCS
jgi:hypothetical protein